MGPSCLHVPMDCGRALVPPGLSRPLTMELRAWGSRVPTSVCSAVAQAKGGESPRRDPQASEPLSQETRGRFPGQKPECACAGVPGPMRVCAHAGALVAAPLGEA